MPSKLKDPTKTTMIRRRYVRAMTKRFNKIKSAIDELVVEDDAFGLNDSNDNRLKLNQQVPYQAWRFQTNARKVQSFRDWLTQQINANVLTVDVKGNPWSATYVESAYKKGAFNAYSQVNKAELAKSADFYTGSREQFLRSSFVAPETVQKLELLYTRSFTELKGITAVMDQQLSRVLVTGLSQGYGINKMARELKKTVSGITRTRANVLARTEVVAAHAEGQLDAYERLGVTEVGIQAEWLTAGDDRVCEMCAPLEGVVFTIEEARSLIPRHPNCRCSWIPASKFRKDKGQIRGKAKKTAVKKSFQGERRAGTLKNKIKKSTWAGKDLRSLLK